MIVLVNYIYYYLLQLKMRCLSSSTSPDKHTLQILFKAGIFLYLPTSISNLCALMRKKTKQNKKKKKKKKKHLRMFTLFIIDKYFSFWNIVLK